MKSFGRFFTPIFGLTAAALALHARADIAVAPEDAHLELVAGVQMTVKNPPSDLLAVVDLAGPVPKLLAEVEGLPTSVIGPPFSAAISRDEHYAFVTACMKIDPADPKKQTEDNRISVVDLKATPPKVIATVTAGKGPAAIALNKQGTLALVANRGDGTVSIFVVTGQNLRLYGSLTIGNATSALGAIAITPDGKHALVARDGDNTVTVLDIDTTGKPFTDPSVPLVKLSGRDIRPGLRPYGMDITQDGAFAVVGNVGYGNGDEDTVALIDLRAEPMRVVDLIAVPQTPEGIKLSPDGSLCAIASQDGSNKPKDSPFYREHGQLRLFKILDGKFLQVATAPLGHWSQGIAFSRDGKTILVSNMVEKNLQVFSWDGENLKDTGTKIQLKAGPVALITAGR